MSNRFPFLAALVLLGTFALLSAAAPAPAPKDAPKGELPIPPGMRAVAFKCEAGCFAGGIVLPGSQIDVLVVETVKDKTQARKVVHDVLVLSIDMPAKGDGANVPPMTVTVAVTAEQAQALALAAQKGTLRVVVRPPVDKTKPAGSESRLLREAVLPDLGAGPVGKSWELAEDLSFWTKEAVRVVFTAY